MSQEPIRIVKNLRARKIVFLVILVMMSVSGLIGSDIYLPMLPKISSIFGKTVDQTQWSLTIYLIGLSVSQIIHGPLCDKFGRKKLAFFGISLYLIASIGCALSDTF